MTKVLEHEPALHSRGDEVVVDEPGIRPWTGVVTAVKHSPVSGWYVEIRRGDEGTYVMPAHVVHPLSERREKSSSPESPPAALAEGAA